MFLSKLEIDRRRWDVVHDLEDRDRLHKKTMSFFPEIPGGPHDNARQLHALLYRVENKVIIMQSKLAPDLDGIGGYRLLGSSNVEKNFASIQAGKLYRFRLDANTSRQEYEEEDDWIPEADSTLQTRKKVRRVGCGTFEARAAWFERAGKRHGFAPEKYGMDLLPAIRVGREGMLELTRFQGHLIVQDLPLFMQALTGGIGQGKSYGASLLSIKNA
jgi:CRISPR system Cascade subunit CasE